MDKIKPVIKAEGPKEGNPKHYFCPKCGKHIMSTKDYSQSGRKDNYCSVCGQGIDWEDIEIETYWAQ